MHNGFCQMCGRCLVGVCELLEKVVTKNQVLQMLLTQNMDYVEPTFGCRKLNIKRLRQIYTLTSKYSTDSVKLFIGTHYLKTRLRQHSIHAWVYLWSYHWIKISINTKTLFNISRQRRFYVQHPSLTKVWWNGENGWRMSIIRYANMFASSYHFETWVIFSGGEYNDEILMLMFPPRFLNKQKVIKNCLFLIKSNDFKIADVPDFLNKNKL